MFHVYLLLILLLGVGLLIFGIRKLSGKLRKFVILTGSSAVGFFAFVHLHNLVYGLFIHIGDTFVLGVQKDGKWVLVAVTTVSMLVPYDEAQFSEIAHTLQFE